MGLENIVNRLNSWNEWYYHTNPGLMQSRKREYRSWRNFVKAIIGIFVMMPTSQRERKPLLVFQEIRNIDYRRQLIDEFEIAVLGSYIERNFAKKNKLTFIWSFPISASLRLAQEFRINLFSRFQINRWSKLASSGREIVVITYEDTQPVGAFFSEMFRSKPGMKCRCVCVQHGLFPNGSVYCDGEFTEYNFLWVKSQIPIINCESKNAREIGPPIIGRAYGVRIKKVIFVGTGLRGNGTERFQITMSFFMKLASLISNIMGLEVMYRPHPNEKIDLGGMQEIKSWFKNIDEREKMDMLLGERALFVGSLSSLMFEASYCGHLTMEVRESRRLRLAFTCDAQFDIDEEGRAARWIEEITSRRELLRKPDKFPEYSFNEALVSVRSRD